MKSLYDFIVEPLGNKYNNEIKVGDKNLVVNTQLEAWKFINREAEVIICLGLPALIRKSMGLKKIPPPIPTTPEIKPKTPPIKIEITIGTFL